MYAKMAQWFECNTPEPEPGVQLQVGMLSLFCFVLSELDIVKVINCFFFLLKLLTF